MKTLGIIGTGNMSKAIIEGIMASGLLRANDVVIYNRTLSKAQDFASKYPGMSVVTSDIEVMTQCKYVLLGMKPQQHEGVITGLKSFLKQEHVIITIAAGLDIAKVRYWFSDDVKVARTMPNTPAQVRMGMTAISFSDKFEADEKTFVTELMKAIGTVEIIDEKLMDSVPAISGSSPAYFFMVIEAMADEGVRQGFARDQAYRMASQAMAGAASMVLNSGLHPGVLKDQVTSPGGTTIEAVKSLEESSMRAAFMKAMAACTEKVSVLKKMMS